MAATRRPYDWGLTEVPMASKYVTDRKLWLNADRTKVVEDGDPEAAHLLASKGKELSAEVVERYGLEPPKPAKPGKPPKGDQPDGDAEAKQQAPVEDKAVKGPQATKSKDKA
jgi:hypothetical protein